MTLSPGLAPLQNSRRWINWELRQNPLRPAKPDKIPVNPITGYACDPTDPAAHLDYETAQARARASGRGVGYVFVEGDGFWFLDIDGCLEANGSWSALAVSLVQSFNGKAVCEVSQSGKGLHLFGWASNIPLHGCRNIPLGLELYHHQRFCALTDQGTNGAIVGDSSEELANVVAGYFPKTAASSDVVDWTDQGINGEGATPDDNELIQIACASGKKSATAYFGAANVTFEDLWTANEEALAKRWPDTGGQQRGFDHSQADSALASHLAYWTGKNCDRIERLMRRSELVRDKWDARPDYLPRTIINACATVANIAKPREIQQALTVGAQPVDPAAAPVTLQATLPLATGGPGALAEPAAPPAPITSRLGVPIMSASEQTRFFAGCVYVLAQNKVWVRADGTLQDKARFEVTHGGCDFVTRSDGGKTDKSAWEAFTRNQCFAPVVAFETCFRPELPPGHLTEDGLVNSYVPTITPMIDGDASKWERHLKLLFPHGDDCAIITTWMAAVIRNPGLKAQWWPVIQGVQGNGKTLINTVVTYSIGRRYTHYARAAALAKTNLQFTSWVQGNLYLCLEEIYVGDKRSFLDEFKDIVTNRTIANEGKGANQDTCDNRINGIMFSNHRDGVPTKREDRRYAILFCAQQIVDENQDDLKACGMTEEYFADLYEWLDGRGPYEHLGRDYGLKVVNHWLRHKAVLDERYNPAGRCQRAPETTSSAIARQESLGHIEMEIMEAVDAGQHGFAGGWICGYYLDALLATQRVRMSRTKRKDMLRNLGYVPHPALPDGRCLTPLDAIGVRPRLYVKWDHLAAQITQPAAAQHAYKRAQDEAQRGPITGVAA